LGTPTNSGPNKRLNGPDGRTRNTSTSNQSRIPGVPGNLQRPTVPGVGTSFGSASGIAGGMASAWASLQQQMALGAAKRKGGLAAFKSERASIRSEAIGAMSDAINAGIEGGMTGSSGVSQAREGVLGQRRADIEGAKATQISEALASKAEDQAAYTSYFIQDAQYKMQAEAMRQQAALAQQAIDAAAANTATMADAYANASGGTIALAPGTKVGGSPVLTTPKGNWKVDGMTFAPGTPLSVMRSAIMAQRADAQAANTSAMMDARLAAGRM